MKISMKIVRGIIVSLVVLGYIVLCGVGGYYYGLQQTHPDLAEAKMIQGLDVKDKGVVVQEKTEKAEKKEKEQAEKKETVEETAEPEVVEEAVEEPVYYEQPAADYYSYDASYSGDSDGILTKSGGVNYYNGRRETWYSQQVLPGGGLDIPGRHIAEDGTIRDADGYICVAASDLQYGSIVDTSLGQGKVYDTGCAPGTTDIYTNW